MKTPPLSKLKSALKKLSSFTNHTSPVPSSATVEQTAQIMYPVYVGKSKRRYLVSSEVMKHPLFQEMVEKSNSSDGDIMVIACEVVMFDHLLWMIDNSADSQFGCMDELVRFYGTDCESIIT